MKESFKNFFLLIFSLGALLLLLEGVLFFTRFDDLLVPSFLTCSLKAYKQGGIPGYHPNQECFQCYHRKYSSPYFDKQVIADERLFDCIRYYIGSHGFRTPPFNKEKKGLRIVAIGDSFTFGEGVKEVDTFPRLIQQETGIETVNIAMQGLNTEYERLVLKKNINLYPDLIILGYVLNDTMPHEETIRIIDDTEGVFNVPWPLSLSRLGSFTYTRILSFLKTKKTLESYRYWFKKGWPESQKELLAIKQLCGHQGSRLLVVLFPILHKTEEHYPFSELHEEVLRFASKNDILVIDLLEVYQEYRTSDLWVHNLDHHPNALAHKIASTEICRWIRDNPL